MGGADWWLSRTKQAASKFADHLARRYQTAKVQRFSSPAGDWWVRVRVLDNDRQRAQKLAAETHTPEGAVFRLVKQADD